MRTENALYQGDCLGLLPDLCNESIDLCLTSVPYNVSLNYDSHVDSKEHGEYLAWLEKVFGQVFRCLKHGGRAVINVGDGKNGQIPTHVDICKFMTRKLGYLYMTTIIWDKENMSSRTSWGSFQSPKAPSFPTPFEYLLVFAKGSRSLQTKGETDLTKDEFVQWSSAMWRPLKMDYRDSRRIVREKVHPAPFPEVIPHRLIKMLSWKDAIVLDPFAGTGTTLLAAKRLGRRYIGMEISKEYCVYAEKRLKHVTAVGSLFE